MSTGLVLVGDTRGLPRLLRHMSGANVRALVRAAIRPEQTAELSELAAQHNVPLLVQPHSGSQDFAEFVERLVSLKPDLIICDSYSMRLPAEILAIPPRGCVNLHQALLPDYRGPNPLQWAIIEGARETGVTLHYMEETIDTGDVIASIRVPLPFSETWVEVAARLDAAAEALLDEQVPRLLRGDAEHRAQPDGPVRVRPRRYPEDGRIDWSMPVVAIHDLVRALVPPLPGAFYEVDGDTVVVDRYLTVAEVAHLKFAGPGGKDLVDGNVSLVPSGGDDRELVLREQDGPGEAILTAIDWPRGSARLESRAASPAALVLCRRFAAEELRLSLPS